MRDPREDLLNEVGCKIVAFVDDEELTTRIMAAVTMCLENYEVSERTTEVGFYNDSSEKLLQLYAGVLLTEGKSKNTVHGYMRFLKRVLGDMQKSFADMSVMDIRIWLAKIQDQVSLRTCDNYRIYLSAFFSWLTNEGYIDDNPMVKIKPIKCPKQKESPFTDVEIDALRMSCDSARNRAIIELLLSSGVRVSELCDLDISDIDFHGMKLIVKRGKGGKQRTAYFDDIARYYLKLYLNEREDDYPYLFVTRNKTRMTTDATRDVLYTLADKAQVGNVHPHRFRRTLATKLHSKGMDIKNIQSILGHSNISTTMLYISDNEELVNAEYRKYA